MFTGIFLGLIVFPLFASHAVHARAAYDIDSYRKPGWGVPKASADTDPYPTLAAHTIGNIGLTVVNKGQFGTGFFTGDVRDPVTGVIAPSCVYPYPGNADYLFSGAFWIGAVVGRDTLVSVGADGWSYVQEMWPDPYPKGDIIRRSISNPDDIDAVSEQDFIAVYTDTVTNPRYVDQDNFDGRPHVPLNIEATQRSYAWSYSYADDFILFDYSIKNIGRKALNKVYMGFYVDGDARSTRHDWNEAQDDICGFRKTIESSIACGLDTINIAWISDNNGLNESSQEECPYGSYSPTSVTGMMVVRTPSDSLSYSFNWWISNVNAALDFGPRKVGTAEDPFRDFGGFLGTPMGDKNKYYILSHPEFDYDQLFTAKDNTSDGWLPRPPQARDFADGYDTRYLLSFGPFDINPGEVLPITFAYVGGEDFFTDCEAYDNVFNASQPEDYYATLHFDKFGDNARWASWIYDNPGVDTDNDGDSGVVRICVDTISVAKAGAQQGAYEIVVDTSRIFVKGDGVPDFTGASPPPPPELYVIDPYPAGDTVKSLIQPFVDDQNRGTVRIKWYGYRSELTKDVFSNVYDFEGYRVYRGLTDNPDDFVLTASFDKIDFNRYEYNPGKGDYELLDPPFTLDSLKFMYGVDFDPYDYPRENPLVPLSGNDSGKAYYFLPQDWNQADLADTMKIHKLFPDQPYPTTLNHDSAKVYYPDELDENGYFKYFMYEYVARNQLPSQKYYYSVTAFDFGSPKSGLESLETPVNRNFIAEYPQNRNSIAETKGLNVVVYPNPYRADADYRANGFEGLGQDNMPDDRVRRIHFTNLPPQCTIRIFSIDGDLVREIDHDCIGDSPECMHDEWDLITRNTQAAVSGIYYYSVESERGNQIGKLVIIM